MEFLTKHLKSSAVCKYISGTILYFLLFTTIAISLASLIISCQYNKEPNVILPEDPLKGCVTYAACLFAFSLIFSLVTSGLHWLNKQVFWQWIYLITSIATVILIVTVVSQQVIQWNSIQAQNMYRLQFYHDLKYYKDNRNVNISPWMNKTQAHFKCCGYNGPLDFQGAFKPASCCDDEKNENASMSSKCRNPPINAENSMGVLPYYHTQNCSVYLNDFIVERSSTFLKVAVTGSVFVGIYLIVFVFLLLFVLNAENIQRSRRGKNHEEDRLLEEYIREFEDDINKFLGFVKTCHAESEDVYKYKKALDEMINVMKRFDGEGI